MMSMCMSIVHLRSDRQAILSKSLPFNVANKTFNWWLLLGNLSATDTRYWNLCYAISFARLLLYTARELIADWLPVYMCTSVYSTEQMHRRNGR